MRTFGSGEGPDRKIVQIQVQGRRMIVIQGKLKGTTKRKEKELRSEAEASSAGEIMARELIARGFVELTIASSPNGAPSKRAPAPVAPQAAARAPQGTFDADYELEDDQEEAAPILAPVVRKHTPSEVDQDETPARSEKKKKKKKRKKKGEKTDWIFVVGLSVASVVLVSLVGYFVWTEFLRPTSIVGTWQGSKLDYEIGKPIIYSQYKLILDEKHRASLTLQKEFTMVGTYKVKGKRLKLHLSSESFTDDREYKFELGRVELSLYDPETKKLVVNLIRLHKMEKITGGPPPRRAAPNMGEGIDAGGQDDRDDGEN